MATQPDGRVARVLAIVALAGAAAATIIAVASIETRHEVSQDQARRAMDQLTVANRNLARTLEGLEPGVSPQQAREADRSTAALSRTLADGVGTEGDLGVSVHAILGAELRYLDAVGSTLNNPRSRLRQEIGQRAIALRQVLENVPGGAPGDVRGGATLVTYSRARVRAPG